MRTVICRKYFHGGIGDDHLSTIRRLKGRTVGWIVVVLLNIEEAAHRRWPVRHHLLVGQVDHRRDPALNPSVVISFRRVNYSHPSGTNGAVIDLTFVLIALAPQRLSDMWHDSFKRVFTYDLNDWLSNNL